MIFTMNYISYVFLFGFWKNKPGKSNNSLVKKKCIESWNASTVFGKGSSNDKAWLYRDINICKAINVKLIWEYMFEFWKKNGMNMHFVVLGACPALVWFLRRKNLTGARAPFQVPFYVVCDLGFPYFSYHFFALICFFKGFIQLGLARFKCTTATFSMTQKPVPLCGLAVCK